MEELTPQSDVQLMRGLQNGRLDAFAELVRRYEGALLRVAENRLGHRQSAEDAVQETLLCVFKSRNTFLLTANFRTWLWTILLNQCRRRAKRDARSPRVVAWTDASPEDSHTRAIDHQIPSRDRSPPATLMLRERCEQLDQMLCRLPECEAEAVQLRFFGCLKYQEIANAMGCSLLTAKNRVRRALERIAEWVRGQSPHSQATDHEL